MNETSDSLIKAGNTLGDAGFLQDSEESYNTVINAKVPSSLIERLDRLADSPDVRYESRSEIIRELCLQWATEKEAEISGSMKEGNRP